MIKVRRNEDELRIEMMPLLDVIFLILTFFLYAMVLMVRVDMVPVPMEAYASGEAPDPTPAIGVVLRVDGTVHVGQNQIALVDIETALKSVLADSPDTAIYLVLEDGEADIDRGPMLTELWDRVRRAGIEIRLVGRPMESPGDE
jgi:biopolymer transport protein ExbD